jgi:multiple sugar transport system permease protein
MVSPSILLLLLMTTFPLVSLVVISFFRIDLTFPMDNGFIGLENYRTLLNDQRFWYSFVLTAVYTVSTVTLQVLLGLSMAMAFFRRIRGEGVLRVSVLLPMILAPVVVGLVWRSLVMTPEYGILDYASIVLGFGSKPWLVRPHWAVLSVILIHTWQWTPFAFLVFLASLQSLPGDILEAAMLDCNAKQRFWWIILPLIWPSLVIVVIFRTMIALRAFDAIFSATGGGPGSATETINLMAYRVAFNDLNLGYGATLGTVLLVITATVSWFFFRLRRSVHD